MPVTIRVFMKNVKVLMRNTVFEIDDVAWINGFAEKACFKVKMRTCRTPYISIVRRCKSDVACFYHFVASKP